MDWDELVGDSRDIQRVSFYIENNDSTGQKKRLIVKKNLRKDQPIKYVFNAELMVAGGDWEMPVLYFRLEFTHDYFYGNKRFKDDPMFIWDLDKKSYEGLYDCYIIIPPAEAGNSLEKYEGSSGKYDWHAYQNSELSKEEEKEAQLTDADKKDCWKWLEELLDKLVEDRHEMLDE